MIFQFKTKPNVIPKPGDTKLVLKYAWLPTRIQTNKGVHYWIWLERYQELKIYFHETGWRTDKTKYNGELYPIRYLLGR